MARTTQTQEERMVLVTIRPPKGEEVTIESWRYYSILNALRQNRATLSESNDTAKWCARKAKPGEKRKLWPEIEVEVSEA